MKSKVLKTIMIIVLMMTLVGADVILLGVRTVQAVYEELEEQNTIANVENIVFDAYFQEGENKRHSLQGMIDQEIDLIIDLTVKDAGVLEDGKITMENANFTIDKAKVQDENIK